MRLSNKCKDKILEKVKALADSAGNDIVQYLCCRRCRKIRVVFSGLLNYADKGIIAVYSRCCAL